MRELRQPLGRAGCAPDAELARRAACRPRPRSSAPACTAVPRPCPGPPPSARRAWGAGRVGDHLASARRPQRPAATQKARPPPAQAAARARRRRAAPAAAPHAPAAGCSPLQNRSTKLYPRRAACQHSQQGQPWTSPASLPAASASGAPKRAQLPPAGPLSTHSSRGRPRASRPRWPPCPPHSSPRTRRGTTCAAQRWAGGRAGGQAEGRSAAPVRAAGHLSACSTVPG